MPLIKVEQGSEAKEPAPNNNVPSIPDEKKKRKRKTTTKKKSPKPVATTPLTEKPKVTRTRVKPQKEASYEFQSISHYAKAQQMAKQQMAALAKLNRAQSH